MSAMPWSVSFLVAVLAFGAGARGGTLRGAEPAGAPEMKGVVYGVFDDKSGARTGRLRIERVFTENRLHGFLRVAWRPRVILQGVTLEFSREAAWPSAGAQIHAALRKLRVPDDGELRQVRLALTGAAHGELTAASVRLRADGVLELFHVSAIGLGPELTSARGVGLALTGENAGRLTPLVEVPPTPPSLLRQSDRPPLEQ